MINISICLTDIPKDRIEEASNGKKYLNLVVDKRKEVDKYGKTHTVYLQQSKEERESKTPKIYLGNGKEFVFDQKAQTPKSEPSPYADSMPSADNSDLPF